MDALLNGTGCCVVWFGQPSAQERQGLASAGWNLRLAEEAGPAGISLRRDGTVVALADLRREGGGLGLAMEQLRADHPWLPWLTLLAQGTERSDPVVERVMRASSGILVGPHDVRSLMAALVRLTTDHETATEQFDLGLVGDSPAIHAVVSDIRKYAPVELPVLITGETGTGKEVAARALHRLSPRCDHLFEAINCGALAPNLVQSELFGHERGAFTGANMRRVGHFELAAGGTVFLDEVADLPADAQTSLLRLLQEGTLVRVGSSQSIKLDVRVLAATHVDLDKAVAQGRFREDLYYRLNVLRLRMPPLRDHCGDVALLAQYFLDAFRARNRTHARAFSGLALKAMHEHAWPGNVRELCNRVQRAAVVADGTQISYADMELQPARDLPSSRASLSLVRVTAERDTLANCLHDSDYNISECARRLQVSRMTIYRLCKKHLLERSTLR